MQKKVKFFILIFLFCLLYQSSFLLNANSFEHDDPSTWLIKKEIIFDSTGSPKSNYLNDLIEKIESHKGEGQRVTKNEFINLLKRSEARRVYSKELIKYATPESIKIQDKAHKDYSKVFLQEKRIKAGVDFLHRYQKLLLKAQRKYGVACHDIVSILMWESGLGQFTGDLRIFNVFMGQLLYLEVAQKYAINKMISEGKKNPLASSKFLEKENKRFRKIKKRAVRSLVALLRQSKTKKIDPLSIKGSWGGAIGYVQFMPYRMNFAVDGNNDGNIDLHTWPDAILSVANYLKEFGNYNMTYKGRKRGIYSYNHSNSYVRGVIQYADTIWKRFKEN